MNSPAQAVKSGFAGHSPVRWIANVFLATAHSAVLAWQIIW
jgi:hypothetical protein